MHPPLVPEKYNKLIRHNRNKLIRRKPLLSENRGYVIGNRAKREFILRASPLGEDDGFLTNSGIAETHSTGGRHRQLLWLIAPLIKVDTSVDLKNNLLPKALNMRLVLGEDRWERYYTTIRERSRAAIDDTEEDRKAKTEGNWLICALILYQAFDYLQELEKDDHALNLEEDDQIYIFNPKDLNAFIWSCLNEGNRAAKNSAHINDAFLENVVEQWIAGQRLSSLIARE